LERLDLSDNALMSEGLLNLSAAFTQLRLSHLNLARTAGGEHGIAIIASSLHSLSCLRALSLASLHSPPMPLGVRVWGGAHGGMEEVDLEDVCVQMREGIRMLSNELSRMFSGRLLEKLNSLDLSHIPLRCSVCVLYTFLPSGAVLLCVCTP